MHKRGSIFTGTLLILVGIFFLLAEFFPGLAATINMAFLWPLIVLALGAFFLVAAVLGNYGLAVPGVILSGIGSNLFYMNTTGNWDFWQLWLLVPSYVGMGIVLSTLLAGKRLSSGLRAGGVPLTIGLILFVIFALPYNVLTYWPALLILLGVWLLLRNARSGRLDS